METKEKNTLRFTGFSDVYENSRPSMPIYPVEIIKKYLGKEPETVVDMGCGTGLSTSVWNGNCKKAIGIEPSDDMRKIAEEKSNDSISFIKAYSDNTGLENDSVDAVICSQSFHWMEPYATLTEVNRILRFGGVFATVDCDWPPVVDWQAEKEYMELYNKIKNLEKNLKDVNDTYSRFPKDKHLENIKRSGYFRYSRELLFSNTELSSADKFINLLMSQGSIQTILKLHPEKIEGDIEKFKVKIFEFFKDESFTVDFSYRMRIAVK